MADPRSGYCRMTRTIRTIRTIRTTQNKVYKVVIIGGKKVGKSSFVQRFVYGCFSNKHHTSQGGAAYPLKFNLARDGQDPIVPIEYQFIVWDITGKECLQDSSKIYYADVDAAIVMYDCTKPGKANIAKYVEMIHRSSPDAEILVVANKIDLKMHGQVKIPDDVESELICVSAKSMYNQEKPWLMLARRLDGNDSLIMA